MLFKHMASLSLNGSVKPLLSAQIQPMHYRKESPVPLGDRSIGFSFRLLPENAIVIWGT